MTREENAGAFYHDLANHQHCSSHQKDGTFTASFFPRYQPALFPYRASPPIGQACKQGSCPNKACCAEAEKNKARPSSQPFVKDDSTASLLVAVITPGLTSYLLSVRPAEHSADPTALGLTASTPPKRVFLCTFLI